MQYYKRKKYKIFSQYTQENLLWSSLEVGHTLVKVRGRKMKIQLGHWFQK